MIKINRHIVLKNLIFDENTKTWDTLTKFLRGFYKPVKAV